MSSPLSLCCATSMHVFYCTMLAQSAVMRLHVVRPSVRDVTFRYHDHIGWNSWKYVDAQRTRRGDHISPVLRQLHWLPVQKRVDFKLACFVYSSLSGQAPPYLADDIHLVSEGPRRRLRLSTDRSCAVLRTHNTFGDRSFAAAGSRLWNSLPVHLRDEDISYNSFQCELKTFWF